MFNKPNIPVPLCGLLAAAAVLFQPAPARASAIYNVTVDTSAIRGAAGFLDFQFAPGADSQQAFAQIGGFSPGAALSGVEQVSGGVSGALPGSLTLDNSTAFNDYFQGFAFTDVIQFELLLGGSAIDAPNGAATSGSTFAFALFDSTGTNPLLTNDPNGNAFTVDVELNGSTSLTAFSPYTQVALVQEAPEPTSASLLVLGLFCIAAGRTLAKRHKNRGEL
jgi:hypothetical protein